MKKIKLLLIGVLGLFLPIIANAASGSISISGSSSVVVGNRITVNVNLSSGSAIGSWEMELNYDKSYLQLVSSSAEAGGTYMNGVTSSASGVRNKSYSFTFKALKSGSTRVSISSYYVVALDESTMSINASSKSIRIMTQQELEASYSKDNNLKSLSVEGYELDKEFNKDTLEYTVNVPTGTTKVVVNASKNDNKASVSGAGEIEVTEGLNTIPIIVTAQNGSEKTYTLTVNVEDQNPINVTIDGKNYTVVKNASLLTSPLTFSETTLSINNYEIPGFINNEANITLVGLKNSEGTIELFEYDNGTYTYFNEMKLDNLILIPTKFTKELDYTKTTVTINGQKVDAYKYSNKSEFVIINAKDLTTGKEALYLYDTKNNQAISFDEEFVNYTNETIRSYSNIIIILAGVTGVMLLLIFALIRKLRKSNKKIKKFVDKQEAKIEATRKLNDVVAEVQKITAEEKQKNEPQKAEKTRKEKAKKKEETAEVKVTEIKPTELKKETKVENKEDSDEMYNLFEDDKKKKKKK